MSIMTISQLESVGFDRPQAEILAAAFSDHIVTSDHLDTRLAEIRIEMRDIRHEIIKWMFALMVGHLTLTVSLLKFF